MSTESEVIFDEQLATELAQSRETLERYSRQLTDIERGLIGRFYNMPSSYQRAYERGELAVYRVGVKSSPAAKTLAMLLRAQGWKDAPVGTRMHGTETYDGDDGGLYLIADVSVPKRMREVRDKAQRKQSRDALSSMDGFAREVSSMGVEVERFDVRMGEARPSDVQANVGEARQKRR